MPAAASLNLRGAMTLSAWIRPSEPQSGWRTILSSPDRCVLPHGRWRQPLPPPRGARRRARRATRRRDDLVLPDAGLWYRARGQRTATRVVAASRAVPCRISRRCRARAFGHACRPNPRGGVVRRDCLAPRRGGEHVPHYRPIHGPDRRFTDRPGRPRACARRRQRRSLGGLGAVVRGGRPVRRARDGSFRPRFDIDKTRVESCPRERTCTGRSAFSTFAASTLTALSPRRARRPRPCRGSFRYAKALVENSRARQARRATADASERVNSSVGRGASELQQRLVRICGFCGVRRPLGSASDHLREKQPL